MSAWPEGGPKPAKPYSTAEASRAAGAFQFVATERHGVAVEWHVNGSDVEIEFDSHGKVCGVMWERG